MSLFVYNLKSTNPYFNLALEEYTLVEKEKNEEDIYLFFYENSEAIILGKNLRREEETYGRKKLPPVIRRSSGGGSVVHFPGNLNYGLIINTNACPRLAPINKSYGVILNLVAKNLPGNLNVQPGGISDLCVNDRRGSRKISGNSQVRKKNWLLHHGSILYDAGNIPKISMYLRHPPKEPDYRKGRSHKDFLITYLPRSARSAIVGKLVKAFAFEFGQTPQMINVLPPLEKQARKYLNLAFLKRA